MIPYEIYLSAANGDLEKIKEFLDGYHEDNHPKIINTKWDGVGQSTFLLDNIVSVVKPLCEIVASESSAKKAASFIAPGGSGLGVGLINPPLGFALAMLLTMDAAYSLHYNKTRKGWTLLDFAAEKGQKKQMVVAKYLITHGADTTKSKFREIATANGHLEFLKSCDVLITNKAEDLDKLNKLKKGHQDSLKKIADERDEARRDVIELSNNVTKFKLFDKKSHSSSDDLQSVMSDSTTISEESLEDYIFPVMDELESVESGTDKRSSRSSSPVSFFQSANSKIAYPMLSNRFIFLPPPFANNAQYLDELVGQIVEVPDDGNCFFHAIEHELRRHRLEFLTHVELRARAVNYLRINPEKCIPENETKEVYLSRMAKDKTWAIGSIIEAIAIELNVHLNIIETLINRITRKKEQHSISINEAMGLALTKFDADEFESLKLLIETSPALHLLDNSSTQISAKILNEKQKVSLNNKELKALKLFLENSREIGKRLSDKLGEIGPRRGVIGLIRERDVHYNALELRSDYVSQLLSEDGLNESHIQSMRMK